MHSMFLLIKKEKKRTCPWLVSCWVNVLLFFSCSVFSFYSSKREKTRKIHPCCIHSVTHIMYSFVLYHGKLTVFELTLLWKPWNCTYSDLSKRRHVHTGWEKKEKGSCIGLMTKLNSNDSLQILKDKGVLRLQFVLSFGRVRKSAFDILRLHWP